MSVTDMRVIILLLFLTILQRSSSSDDNDSNDHDDNDSDSKQLGDVRDKIFDMDFVTLSELRHTDRQGE